MNAAIESFTESFRLDPETESVLRTLHEMYPARHVEVAVKASAVLDDSEPFVRSNPSIEITVWDNGPWVFCGSTFADCLRQAEAHKASGA